MVKLGRNVRFKGGGGGERGGPGVLCTFFLFSFVFFMGGRSHVVSLSLGC